MITQQLTRIFIAKLAGTPVFDLNGDRVGKIRDVVATAPQHLSQPRIIGFIVEVPQRRRIFIQATRVTNIEDGGVVTTGSLNIRRYQPRHGEVQLLAEFLDRSVALASKAESVIIEDLGMEITETGDWRLTLAHVRSKRRGLRKDVFQTIDWRDLEVLTTTATVLSTDADDLNQLPAQDVAAALAEMRMEERKEIARNLDDEKLADVLEEMDDADRIALVSTLEEERIADVLGEMSPDDAADVLKEVSVETAEELLSLMDDSEDVRRLMTYEDYSAGGMMTTDPVILTIESSVADALASIRRVQRAPALASQVFVCRSPLETPTGRLVGVVHLQRLLREPPALNLGLVIDANHESVSPETSLHEVVRILANYNLMAVPVVDEHDRLLGAVTVDDVLDHLLPENWRNSSGRER